MHVWRLVAVTGMSLALLGCSDGPPSPVASVAGSVAAALPTPTVSPKASVSFEPASRPPATPEASSAVEPTPFDVPAPVCPAPPEAVKPPTVRASVGAGLPIDAVRGSSSFTTCSTVAADDVPQPPIPETGLLAKAGDTLRLTLQPGWRFLRWEGNDDVRLDSGTVFMPVDTPEHTDHIEVPVRSGDHVGVYNLWITSVDGRVVGNMEIFVRVNAT